MKNTVGLLAIALVIVCSLFVFQPKNVEGPRVPAQTLKTLQFPYAKFNQVLKVAFPQAETSPRYDLLKANSTALDDYLGLISEIGPRSAPHRFTRREQRLAYMLNAYTAGLFAIIRDHCPISSVEDPYWFGGLFWRVSLRIGGEDISLSDLAAEISKLALDDPRVMLAVSRGMKANLPVRQIAWTPENLEQGFQELEAQLLHPPFTNSEGSTLRLGAPYKWYEHRFLPSPRKYIEARKNGFTKELTQIKFVSIDTSLDGPCQ